MADTTTERLHALDLVRAVALLLGLCFHATMSFLPGPQLWVVRDVESPGLAIIFYVSHMFRMTLFFLIAGFFARLLLERRGTRGFVADRARRITLPFLVFWPLVLAGMAGAFLWASRWTGVTLAELARSQASAGPAARGIHAVPLTHLWFLYLLTVFYLVTLALRWAGARTGAAGPVASGLDSLLARLVVLPILGPAFIALPVAVALVLRPNWQGWIGIQAPAIGLVPNAGALVGYATAFLVGWLLHRRRGLFEPIRRWWPANLSAAVLLTILCLAVDGLRPILIPAPGTGSGPPVALAYAVGAWCWAFGLIGAALRFVPAERPAIRYVADASYWIYLVHLPVVMAFQVLVWPLVLPAVAKYLLVVTAAFAVTLGSYEIFVRHGFLGRWLNGRAFPRRGAASVA